MNIVDKTVDLLEDANIVDDIEKYEDATELKCSNCGTITQFYYVDIEPYIDFWDEEYLYEDDVQCPICGSKELTLHKLCFGKKSPDGRKYMVIKKGDLDNGRKQ